MQSAEFFVFYHRHCAAFGECSAVYDGGKRSVA
jgi:hypothetical protein